MIKKITILCGIGFFVALFFAQFDLMIHTWLKQCCQNSARQSLGCHATFTIESLNFFFPAIILTDVTMKATDDSWSWQCGRCEVYASWIQLLLKGVVEKHITMTDFSCVSLFKDGSCAIESHINALNSASFFPVHTDIKSLEFKNAEILLSDEKKCTTVSFFFNSSSLKITDQFKTMVSLYNGTIEHAGVIYSTEMAADISVITRQENNTSMFLLNGSGLLRLPHMHDQGVCYVAGSLESGRGRCTVRNAYNSFTIDPIIITDREIKIESSMPLSYVVECITKEAVAYPIKGTISSFITVDKKDKKMNGYAAIQEAFIADKKMCDSAKLFFTKKDMQWKYRISGARNNEECKGYGNWDEKEKQGSGCFFNTTPLLLPSSNWRIAQNNLLCHMLFHDDEIVGIHTISAYNVAHNSYHTVQGGFSYKKDEDGLLSSLVNDTEFHIKAKMEPSFAIRSCSLFDKNKKQLISLEENKDDKRVHGYVSFAFIRHFINVFFHYDIQGEGMFVLQGNVSLDDISINITADDTIIRLPETYNFIDGLKACIRLDMKKNVLFMEDAHISLNTGTIDCARATAFFNEERKLVSAHVPFLLDQCLFNIKKDLFAIISGNLLFSYKEDASSLIKGAIFIDRAQLKENIFSHVIQKQLFSYPRSVFSVPGMTTACDISVETQSPIRVETAFLQTNAHVNVRIQNNIIDPAISGTISLQSGNLIFPYQPLAINKGLLTFSPDQSLDPSVELVARNRIKNHDITLQVAGSLLNHHIMLDSSPPLSEEQIMALLLVGSQENTLNSMMPSLIVQNLKNLIFAHNQETFFDKYFAPLLRPFRISLMPNFADQTGRGGLRGLLEININDRLKAMIQKNFSLTEDTRVEIEFQPSDDITLRGIRDERRDLGGEIEMKWKF